MHNHFNTVLIVGLGDLGAELAKRLQVAGLHVVGVRRSMSSADNSIQVINADVTQPARRQALPCLVPAKVFIGHLRNGAQGREASNLGQQSQPFASRACR